MQLGNHFNLKFYIIESCKIFCFVIYMTTRFRRVMTPTREEIQAFMRRDRLERQRRELEDKKVNPPTMDYIYRSGVLQTEIERLTIQIREAKNEIKSAEDELTFYEFIEEMLNFENLSKKEENIKQYKLSNKTEDIITCSICCEDESLTAKLPCNHYFHYECIHTWIINKINEPTCPNCRHKLVL